MGLRRREAAGVRGSFGTEEIPALIGRWTLDPHSMQRSRSIGAASASIWHTCICWWVGAGLARTSHCSRASCTANLSQNKLRRMTQTGKGWDMRLHLLLLAGLFTCVLPNVPHLGQTLPSLRAPALAEPRVFGRPGVRPSAAPSAAMPQSANAHQQPLLSSPQQTQMGAFTSQVGLACHICKHEAYGEGHTEIRIPLLKNLRDMMAG